MLKLPSPPYDTAVRTHISCHVFKPGPRLSFSLYAALTQPWESYRQWPSAQRRCCLPAEHEQLFLMCLSKSASVWQNIVVEKEVATVVIKTHKGKDPSRATTNKRSRKSCYGALKLWSLHSGASTSGSNSEGNC